MKTLSFYMLMVNPRSLMRGSRWQLMLSSNLALVTGQLSKEITDVGNEIEKLFGVLDEEILKLQ